MRLFIQRIDFGDIPDEDSEGRIDEMMKNTGYDIRTERFAGSCESLFCIR